MNKLNKEIKKRKITSYFERSIDSFKAVKTVIITDQQNFHLFSKNSHHHTSPRLIAIVHLTFSAVIPLILVTGKVATTIERSYDLCFAL